MSKPEDNGEALGGPVNPTSPLTPTSENDEILQKLADLRKRKAQLEVESCNVDGQLEQSRQEIDTMMRDVDVLNNLDASQYEHLKQEMGVENSVDTSPRAPDTKARDEYDKP